MVLSHKILQSDAQLVQIALAGSLLRLLFRPPDRRKQQGGKDRDDCHHRQQLDQREPAFFMATAFHARLDSPSRQASRRPPTPIISSSEPRAFDFGFCTPAHPNLSPWVAPVSGNNVAPRGSLPAR